MINPDIGKIEGQLSKEGFVLCKQFERSSWFTFVRSNKLGLYESISYETSGRRNLVRDCLVRISVMKGTYWHKDFTETVRIKALSIPVSSRSLMDEWQNSLCRIAPQEAALLSTRKGPELLEKTDTLRKICSEYSARVFALGKPREAKKKLDELASASQKSREVAWSSDSSVNGIPEESSTYSLAILCIVIFHQEIEGSELSQTISIWDSILMMKIQLVADLLFCAGYGERVVRV